MTTTGRPRVVVMSAGDATARATGAFDAEGLDVWSVAATTISPPSDWLPLDACLRQLETYTWLAFTSGNAVDFTCGRPAWRAAQERRALPRVAAVGAATAERLAEHGVSAAVVAGGSAEALADALLAEDPDLRGRRVLWPRGDRALATFPERLAAAGAKVDAPVAYRTVYADPEAFAPILDAVTDGSVAAVAFMSPSSAEATARALGVDGLRTVRERTVIASIGPTTSAALARLGAPPHVEAATQTLQGLALAIRERLSVSSGDRT